MLARLSAFVIWALVAATIVFWGLRLIVQAPGAPDRTVVVGDASAARGDLSRLLGAAPAAATGPARPVDTNSRFRLLGIVAPKDAGQDSGARGVALIAVDGKMPKAYVVGAAVDGDLMLQSVSLRTVSIGTGGGAAAITLELPPPAAAAVGKLPPGGTSTSQAPMAPSPQIAPPVSPVVAPAPMTPQMAVPPAQTDQAGAMARPGNGAMPPPGQPGAAGPVQGTPVPPP